MNQSPSLKDLHDRTLRRILFAFALFGLAPCPLAAQAPPVTGGLKVRLDAAAIEGVGDGETVTLWADSAVGLIDGDEGQDAVIGHGSGAPKFVASDPLFGGRPSVQFAGGDSLGFAGSLGLDSAPGAQAFTVFIVAASEKSTFSSGLSFGDIKDGNGDGTWGASVKCDVGLTQAGLRFNNGNRLFGPPSEAGKARIGLFRMGVGDTYGKAVFRSDNREAIQSGSVNPNHTPSLFDEGYHVGAGLNGANGMLDEFLDGRIAEILFYNRELGDAEANAVGYHLEQKYGLDTQFVAPTGRDPRPNIVLILLDDMGWSDLGCYGGEARTPRIDAMAEQGLKFRNFHNTSRCSTTRMSLLTGAYTHQVAQNPAASLPELRTDNNVTLPELLRDHGYRTYMAGKWHLGTDPGKRTTDRGFQHVFGFGAHASGSGVNFWNAGEHSLVSSGNEILARSYPAGTFYQSDAIGDYSVDFLNHHFGKGDGERFFLYLPFNPPHFDLQAPAALADTYMDIYAEGWNVVRQKRYDRMLANGVIDASHAGTPFGDTPYNTNPAIQPVPAWTSLDAARRADLTRRMALYAAMIDKVDQNVGRVIDRLSHTGQLDNTIIMLMSDNGGNAEGGVFGRTFGQNNHPPLTGAQLTNMGQRGANDGLWLGGGWANVCNVPFRYYKRYSHEGGIRTPLVVHWPAGIEAPGRWTDQYGHLIDVMKTILEITDIPFPATRNGNPVVQPEGESLMPAFRNEALFPRQVGYEHESTRAWVDGDWKLVTKTFSSSDGSSPANAYELYWMPDDPIESANLALVEPQRLRMMVGAWNAWAARVGVPASRLLEIPLPIPAATPGDLFTDHFGRPDSTDIDASSLGMGGSRVPPIGAGAAYYEGFEGTGLPDSIQILDGRLQMAVGQGGMAENGIMLNFVGQDILEAGGFSVETTITALNNTAGGLEDRYFGFGVGLTEAEAAGGGDIAGPNSFRGSVGNPIGKADFFVELDMNGNLKAWSKGQLLESVPVGATQGTITAKFALDGFTTASAVEVTMFFNGREIDLNGADPDSTTRTFSWDHDDTNYIGLSARVSEYASIDNLAVRKLPLADSLAVWYAMNAGLGEDDSAPWADPDGDGLPNFLEWAIGTDPGAPDAGAALLTLLTIEPGESRFRFESRQLTGRVAADVEYVVMVSTDLEGWKPVEAMVVSPPQAILEAPGYETVELELPAEEVAEKDRLFVLISIHPKS